MKFKRTATAVAALGATLAMASPAMASGLTTAVSVGGSSADADHPITATSGLIEFDVKNNSGDIISMTCESATVNAPSTVNGGVGEVDLARIEDTMTWSNCVGPGGALNVSNQGTWLLHRDGAATAGQETVAGHIDNVVANVTSQVPGICSFTVTGSADGTFNESTQTLTVNETGFGGELTIASVDPAAPCLGQIQAGNSANFSGTFQVDSADGSINLS